MTKDDLVRSRMALGKQGAMIGNMLKGIMEGPEGRKMTDKEKVELHMKQHVMLALTQIATCLEALTTDETIIH
jgi:hypothetical protein